MKGFAFIQLLAVAVAAVRGCADHDDHLAARSLPSSLVAPPTRPLEWGDFNVIHTTDSHGWLLGHQKTSFPEPNYSGDLGDFASFVSHMKNIAIEKDVDLLLVDSGDLHDGTGLTDGFPVGGTDAHDANQFLKKLDYDIMAIGNHELYIYNNTLDMKTNFAPALKGRYLSSNVNITYVNDKGKVVNEPVGERFAKFTTRKGRKVTSLGVLFDFTGNDVNTTVQPVEAMVKETWFLDAIKSEPDVFLLVGHMPVARDNWPLVFNAIRAVHPTTPILIFGGHTHIRDCLQLDGRSMSLESGRYMETVGWMSANLAHQTVHSKNITFSRRYIDPNPVSYEFHTGRHVKTTEGNEITAGLKALAKKFKLDTLFGTAPHDFTVSRAPYPSNDSSLSLFAHDATPFALAINNTRTSIPNIIISNSGSQRFDIYAGAFTINDQLTASPFADSFLYIPSVPLSVASQVLSTLNNDGSDNRKRALDEFMYGRGYVDKTYREWLSKMNVRHNGEEKRAARNLTLGYVTSDACPGVGDDSLHSPLPSFDIPDFIASATPDLPDDTPIDLVFVDFIESQLLSILNQAQSNKTFTTSDVKLYSPVLANAVLGLYAQSAWN
ncbi:Metallo-dependent phosphatase-like protein [Mycena floridula]|nr:Metallo-dependent phosphatase-like protein [Mycena floridula]